MTSGHPRAHLGRLLGILGIASAIVVTARTETAGPPTLTDQQIETFLKKAKIVRSRPASKGITGSLRATLTDGVLTHDAHVQMVDVTQERFEGTGGVEFNFRDSWKLNVAAYRLD